MPGPQIQPQGPLQVFRIADWTAGIINQSNNGTTLRVPSQQVSSSFNTYGCMSIPTGGLLLGPGVRTYNNGGPLASAPASINTSTVTGIINYVDGASPIFAVTYITNSSAHITYNLYDIHANNVFTNITKTSFSGNEPAATYPWSMVLYNGSFLNYVGLGNSQEVAGINATSLWAPGTPNSPTDLLSAATRLGIAVPANGRVWFLETGPISEFYDASGYPSINAAISYTDPTTGASTNLTIGTQGTIVDYNNPSNFGGWGSFGSQSTLLVKTGDGGVAIAGDIFNPTAISVPTIPGTHGMIGQACASPIGLVYRSRNNGVWAWSGGSAASKISNQLDDSIWPENQQVFPTPFVLGYLSGNNISTYFYNAQYFRNLIFFDGGMFYDIQQNAWWRLPPFNGKTNSSTWNHIFYNFSLTGTGTDFSAMAMDQTTKNETLETGFNFNMAGGSGATRPTGFYDSQWESNPIQLTATDDVVEVQEIHIVMMGSGTMQVGVFGIDGSNPVMENVAINSSSFQRYRIVTKFQTDVIILRLGFIGTVAAAQPTPIIESVEIKYRPVLTVPVAAL